MGGVTHDLLGLGAGCAAPSLGTCNPIVFSRFGPGNSAAPCAFLEEHPGLLKEGETPWSALGRAKSLQPIIRGCFVSVKGYFGGIV